MSVGANPISSPEDWDAVYLSGIKSPGVCDVDSANIKYKWDKKDGPGTTGESNTFRGLQIATFNIVFRFWTSDQVDAWDEFQKELLEIDSTRVPLKAADIEHPALSRLNIVSVTCDTIGQLVKISTGYYSCTVTFTQYKPPPKSKASGDPNGSATKKVTDPDPEIEALQAEKAKLRAEAGLPL